MASHQESPAPPEQSQSASNPLGPLDPTPLLAQLDQPQPSSPLSPLIACGPVGLRARDRHFLEIQAIKQACSDNTEGTVLFIVKFPKNAGFGCDGTPWTDYQQKISYEKLVASGSSKLLSLLTPRKQEIFRRRHGWEKLPDGIEYILDLTPLDESDDHANVTCALWLPDAAKIWWLAGHYESDKILTQGPSEFGFNKRPDVHKAIGAVLALGHDDNCKLRSCALDDSLWSVQGAHGIYDPEPWDQPIPEYRQIDGYCPIRHRVSIIRLIRAVNGSELLVNSATRMWTLAQMAVHLDLTRVVRDEIAQWFLASPNSKFIELFPEDSFKIAHALQLKDVLLSAYQIMVNEGAIDLVATDSVSQPSSDIKHKHAWNLRKRGDYGDYPQDPVEYASRAFAERISTQFAALQSDICFDSLDCEVKEWRKFQEVKAMLNNSPSPPQKLVEACESLERSILDTFHLAVESCLGLAMTSSHLLCLIDVQRAHHLNPRKVTSFAKLYHNLNDSQKAMTPFFWNELLQRLQASVFQARKGSSIGTETNTKDFNMLLRQALRSNTPPLSKEYNSLSAWEQESLCFNVKDFEQDLNFAFGRTHHKITFHDNETIQMVLSDHLLLKLDEEELKFLPMWAGGLDDGSGGVFQEPVPNTEMGPIEPGPGYHTGYSIAPTDTDMESVATSGMFSELGQVIGDLELDDATVARSIDVQEGSVSTTPAPNRNRVIIAESTASEQFSSDMGDYADAMYVDSPDHLAQGRAIATSADRVDDDVEYVIEEDEEADMLSDGSESTLGESDFDMI